MARAKKFGDPLIKKIAAAHGRSEAQIMIRWPFCANSSQLSLSGRVPWAYEEMAEMALLDEDFHASSASASQHIHGRFRHHLTLMECGRVDGSSVCEQ